MDIRETKRHSALVVSSSEQFNTIVKKSLSPRDFVSVEFRRSSSLARRCILERYYDLVIINMPLPDERGEEIALDVAENINASVLLVAPQEIYEDILDLVTDSGILVISKPGPKGRIDKAIRYLTAIQNKMHIMKMKLQASQEKMEDLRNIDKAKFLLMEKRHMTEDEAHRFIGKTAMDHGLSRGRIARRILDDLT